MKSEKIGDLLRTKGLGEEHEQATHVRDRFWRTLKRAARQIPFMEDVVASYYCALDPATPNRVRGILLAALAYFVLPFDFLPDFIALIGFSDDVAVLAAAIASIRNHLTPAHYEAARAALQETDEAPVSPA